MKLFLLTTIVAPAIDFFAADGRYVTIAIGYVASAGHSIASVGATLMPSIGG